MTAATTTTTPTTPTHDAYDNLHREIATDDGMPEAPEHRGPRSAPSQPTT